MNTINTNNTTEYITKDEFYSVIFDLKQSIADGFDRVFVVMDENNRQLKYEMTEIATEIKKEISELRSDMNQRFFVVDKRLLKIESDMVHRYEFEPLVKRVKLLEA
jgi:hypothetical protein